MTSANNLATWVAIAATVIGGGVWIGAVASDVQNTKVIATANTMQIDKLRDQVPADIASMKSKIEAIEGNVKEIKDSQKQILDEVRKK